jgi:hypothetical protein
MESFNNDLLKNHNRTLFCCYPLCVTKLLADLVEKCSIDRDISKTKEFKSYISLFFTLLNYAVR